MADRTPPTARSIMLRFALGSAIAAAVALVGGYLVLRGVATDEAKRETRTRAEEAAALVEAVLPPGITRGDPEARRAVDEAVVGRILSNEVVRVKLWTAGGRIVYSDDPEQIGQRYELGGDQREVLELGGAAVEVSDLGSAENLRDRGLGRVVEAYTRIRTPSGEPLLFEVYRRAGSADADARRLLVALAPPILGALLLVLLVQVPLVWSLTRSLQRGHEEREALLATAIASSQRERQRVASYLHDGPVQEIAGLAFALAPLADRARGRGDAAEEAELRAALEGLRATVRDLRALLVDLHPPHLAAAGLEAALADVVSPLRQRGVEVSLAVDGAERLGREQQAVVYRVAQEAVRNVIAHAAAGRVTVTLDAENGCTRLVVADDGRGFAPGERAERREEGHLGLSLAEELARQAGGRLDVEAQPGEGTRVVLEVPSA
jgi:signal transduction histidine kinase